LRRFKNKKGEVNGSLLVLGVVATIIVIVVATIVPALTLSWTDSSAFSYLKNKGYTAYADSAGNWHITGDVVQDGGFTSDWGNNSVTNISSIEAPTGRTATYVVAASDATTLEKAQADVVCDGVSDNVQINTALTLGGRVILSSGNFNTGANLYIPANTTFEGQGRSTIITASGASLTNIIVMNGDNAVVKNMKIDVAAGAGTAGSRPNCIYATGRTKLLVEKVWMLGDLTEVLDPSVTSQTGVYWLNCTDSHIMDCVINDTKADGIYMVTCYRCIIRGNRITTDPAFTFVITAIYLNQSDDNIISENIIGQKYASGITLYKSSRNTVNANYVDGVLDDGIQVLSTPTTYNVISNNVVTNSAWYGIRVSSLPNSNTFIGNTVSSSGLEGFYVLDSASENSFIGNSVSGNGLTEPHRSGMTFATTSYNTITGNNIGGNGLYGIELRTGSEQNTITDNIFLENYAAGISVASLSHYNTIANNQFWGNTNLHNGQYDSVFLSNSNNTHINNNVIEGVTRCKYEINISTSTCNDTLVESNYLHGSGGSFIANINDVGTRSIFLDNQGYIASGEIRAVSGTLTAGNANAIGFAWHNPEAQDIVIKKVVVEVTTIGGTAGSHLDVGIADAAAGTNRGTEFFNDILLNTSQIDDSYLAGDGGTQTKWVVCQDSASATDGWVVGQILDANAASLVGRYYIEYAGR